MAGMTGQYLRFVPLQLQHKVSGLGTDVRGHVGQPVRHDVPQLPGGGVEGEMEALAVHLNAGTGRQPEAAGTGQTGNDECTGLWGAR